MNNYFIAKQYCKHYAKNPNIEHQRGNGEGNYLGRFEGGYLFQPILNRFLCENAMQSYDYLLFRA